MRKLFFILVAMMLLLGTSVVSQACVDLPLDMPIVASAAYAPSMPVIASHDTLADASGGMEFVHVSGGCYCMGAADGEGTHDATPAHQACVDDYYMGKYEVTQAQWRAVMGSSPSSSIGNCADCPVVDVSWNEAQEFVARLSKLTGKEFRLPTEAEWEFASRSGGTQTASADAITKGLRPVGSYQPNELGIYGMQGGVWEWTGDWYGTNFYNNSPKYNPEGPSHGVSRVLRGTAWVDAPKTAQETRRIRYEPWVKRAWVGFRLSSPGQHTIAHDKNFESLAMKQGSGKSLQCKLAPDDK